MAQFIFVTLIHFLEILVISSNEDAKRLLDDLLSNYNSFVRPVENSSEKIIVYLGLKLSQIADIDEKNQIMSTNVWLHHLRWDKTLYANITKVNIPSSNIWLPDIVLYNNADGDYQITTKTKATVHFDGNVVWEPPMIYKSYCSIDIEYYPFDIQNCYFKFGSWTYDGGMINLEHINEKNATPRTKVDINKDGTTKLYTVENGIDMADYYTSVEWDVLAVPAQKNIKVYACCPNPYYDIYFNITIRRKALFYTVNLIIPCVNISFLSVLVFFLPSDSGEKLTLGISILVALLVFYLLLIELIPPTSIVIPLIGKYLLFTLILVNVSILLTILVLNMFHRKPDTHKMPKWMKRVFIDTLPQILMIERPIETKLNHVRHSVKTSDREYRELRSKLLNDGVSRQNLKQNQKKFPPSIVTALEGLQYISEQMEKDQNEQNEIDDWKYVSMVIDRLLLWIFIAIFLFGTCWILLQAPSIYDERKALTKVNLNLNKTQ